MQQPKLTSKLKQPEIHSEALNNLVKQIMGRVEGTPLNSLAANMFDAAIPLWLLQIKDRQPNRKGTPTQVDYDWLASLDAGDLCLRMEYLLHKGPKAGDSAKVFNDTARLISIMAFCPGGITVFGRHWEAW